MSKYLVAVGVALLLVTGCTSTGSVTGTASDGTGASSGSGDTSTPQSDKPAEPKYTKSQEQAIGSAEDYLQFQAFSKKGLIEQLSSEYGEGFSKKDATFAVNHIDVDWNEQAARAAQDYLDSQHFSCKGLVDQLSSPYGEQFTKAQAAHGAKKAGLC